MFFLSRTLSSINVAITGNAITLNHQSLLASHLPLCDFADASSCVSASDAIHAQSVIVQFSQEAFVFALLNELCSETSMCGSVTRMALRHGIALGSLDSDASLVALCTHILRGDCCSSGHSACSAFGHLFQSSTELSVALHVRLLKFITTGRMPDHRVPIFGKALGSSSVESFPALRDLVWLSIRGLLSLDTRQDSENSRSVSALFSTSRQDQLHLALSHGLYDAFCYSPREIVSIMFHHIVNADCTRQNSHHSGCRAWCRSFEHASDRGIFRDTVVTSLLSSIPRKHLPLLMHMAKIDVVPEEGHRRDSGTCRTCAALPTMRMGWWCTSQVR